MPGALGRGGSGTQTEGVLPHRLRTIEDGGVRFLVDGSEERSIRQRSEGITIPVRIELLLANRLEIRGQ